MTTKLRARKYSIRPSTEDILLDIFIYIALALVFFATAYPFFYGAVLSFNDSTDTAMGGVYFWPRVFTIENYKTFFDTPKWVDAFFVSVARTVVGTVITVVFTTMVAYGLSEKTLKFRKTYMMIVVIAMYFIPGIIPYYVTLKMLHMPNTFFVYIIPPALNLFFVFISVSFFEGLPKEIRESGMLDGASELKILFRLIIPIALPLLATTAIFSGVYQWNTWFDAAYLVKDDGLRTLSYRMIEVMRQAETPSTQQAAMRAAAGARVSPFSVRITAMMISVIPILCIYPFLQKYFVTGLTIGAVKG